MSDSNRINVTSYNQSGGITAHTVNVGAPARHLDGDVIATLRARILQTASKVVVASVSGDVESYGFAREILDWLHSNGYTNLRERMVGMAQPPLIGQYIEEVRPGEFDVVIGSRPI